MKILESITITPQSKLRGETFLQGDKSISHRALIMGGMAHGETRIRNLNRGEDCYSTMSILRSLGAEVEDSETVTVRGGRFEEPDDVLDAGNSGTTLRLLTGVLAGEEFFSVITGDSSLRGRPVRTVIEPLKEMGAEIHARKGDSLPPVSIQGRSLRGIHYEMPVTSAQVKSALLLAGLGATGNTRVHEKIRTRDHTERMIRLFGGEIETAGDGITVSPSSLKGTEITVPGDISSASFLLVAAIITKGSSVTIRNVSLNPTRTGFLDVLKEMGAKVEVVEKEDGWEPRGDITASSSEISSVRLKGEAIPGTIDEIPILAVAMAFARGESVIADAGELRVKETDRIRAIALGLRAMGVQVEENLDGVVIMGGEPRGGRVEAFSDHRIAMAFSIAGLAARGKTEVCGAGRIDTSFPGFLEKLKGLGAKI